MPKQIKLRKGLNIRMKGKADKILIPEERPGRFAVKPVDFPGMVPKMTVKPGAEVKAGTTLFFDKKNEKVKYASPVSGLVLDVVRGERRRILEVIIEAKGDEYEDFGKADPEKMDAEEIKKKLLDSGLWPAVRQRPYHIVADPDEKPRSIFISGFDSAPLAPDYDYIIDHLPKEYYLTGIKVLRKLTEGNVYLSLSSNTTSDLLKNTPGVEINYFSGPHPAGNIGVQIHHIAPVNKGETVWYVNLQDIVSIGRLFEEGKYAPDKIVALAGSEVEKPRYYRTRSGASISPIVKGNITSFNVRYISGNVLTGQKIQSDGFIGYYDSMVSVIPEGDYYEFFGWITPGLNKFSLSRTFLTWLMPGKKYRLDTNMHGGERAFVVTGEYEKVLPMDIYPMQLLKSILVEDIDRMEQLGIYEVADEDFALCEFICPSKVEIQSIIRKGLDLMVKEMS
ncbi:MAG: Na(+)-translocating NADH-quinone reductase subunit A [Bacteroidales bacterium]|jgi:Na+-transporting NADH:ubiquinone oxidoreductase subunit A|nr:Na(+)-translocating NADH-quinone reductase subunit A [Bacteroidales bacterium]